MRWQLVLWSTLGACVRPPETALPVKVDPPRLVVFVIVDQLPTRLLERTTPLATGGLKRLTGEHAWQATARHQHAVTFTCPGHATLSTGASPSVHGIPSNDWLMDGQPTYCAKLEFLRAEPVADVFQEAGGKVVSLSLKDRGAILLGGHHPTAVSYFDKKAKRFTAPFDDIELDTYVSSEWTALHPEAYAAWFPDQQAFESDPSGRGQTTFPHAPLGPDGFGGFMARPESGTALTDLAIESVKRFSLGSDPTPDLLTVSYSQIDYIGHSFTSDSWEAVDGLLRLDTDLERLFDALDASVGEGKYTVVLSSDHGSAPHTPIRINTPDVVAAANKALAAQGILEPAGVEDPGVWLPDSIPSDKRSTVTVAVAEALENIPEIARALPWRVQTATEDAMDEAIRLSVDSERSGDIYLVRDENALFNYPGFEGLGTSHGTPYDYDQLVPWLMFGARIQSGTVVEEQDTRSIAPTIAALVNLRAPRDSQKPPYTAK